MSIVDNIVKGFFAIDIILTFFVAYFDRTTRLLTPALILRIILRIFSLRQLCLLRMPRSARQTRSARQGTGRGDVPRGGYADEEGRSLDGSTPAHQEHTGILEEPGDHFLLREEQCFLGKWLCWKCGLQYGLMDSTKIGPHFKKVHSSFNIPCRSNKCHHKFRFKADMELHFRDLHAPPHRHGRNLFLYKWCGRERLGRSEVFLLSQRAIPAHDSILRGREQPNTSAEALIMKNLQKHLKYHEDPHMAEILRGTVHGQAWSRKNVSLSLHIAISIEDDSLLHELLSSGADPNECDSNGRTVLHLAASKGDFTAVVYLIYFGADPNKRDIYPYGKQ